MADDLGKNDKGFSGLSLLVSNIETLNITEEPVEFEEKPLIHMNARNNHIKQDRNWGGASKRIREWIRLHKGSLIFLGIGLAVYIWFISDITKPQVLNNTNQSTTSTSVNTSTISSYTYEKPPIGTTTFNVAQIRWALREKIRLDTIRNFISSDAAIEEFNLMINDYNKRAGQYKYRPSDLQQAQRDIETIKSQIVAEARVDARKLGN